MAIGTDVVEVVRIRRAIERNPKFVGRVFTDSETSYCFGSSPDLSKVTAERFAARFAAKEAVLKVLGLGLGGCKFTDIEVQRDPSGQPNLKLTGRALERAQELGIGTCLISLSHTAEVAQAFAAGVATN